MRPPVAHASVQPRRRRRPQKDQLFAAFREGWAMTNRQCTHTDQLIARLGEVRMDWTLPEVRELFALPFADLLFHAQRVHRANFDPNEVQVSTLLSVSYTHLTLPTSDLV